MTFQGRVFAAIFVIMLAAVFAVGQDMPKPKLGFVRVTDVEVNGRPFRMYEIEIVNRAEFANELFAPSQDLPPCGLNNNSSRTWIEIYTEKGRIYGHCGIHVIEELSSLKFNIPADAKQPVKIYVDFVDRREGKIVRSNKVNVEN